MGDFVSGTGKLQGDRPAFVDFAAVQTRNRQESIDMVVMSDAGNSIWLKNANASRLRASDLLLSV